MCDNPDNAEAVAETAEPVSEPVAPVAAAVTPLPWEARGSSGPGEFLCGEAACEACEALGPGSCCEALGPGSFAAEMVGVNRRRFFGALSGP